MPIRDCLTEFFTGNYQGAPIFGFCRGAKGGDIGVWGKWPAQENLETYRMVLKYSGQRTYDDSPASGDCSYTFGPSIDKPFYHSLETPLEFKDFLAGKNRAKTGQVTLEIITSLTTPVRLSADLSEVQDWYRQKGKEAPEGVVPTGFSSEVDKRDLAMLRDSDLKAYSDKIRAEIEEKRRKKEEEEKAKAEAAKQAALKAAQAASKPAAAAGAAAVDRTKPTLQPGKVILVYGSSTGNTAGVANSIKTELGAAIDQVKNITEIHPVDMTQFQCIILGIPTWHIGELQDDWAAVMSELDPLNFAGKKVAVFGLGDQKGYPDTYVDAMADLLAPFEKTGAKLVGLWPTAGYDFKKSRAIRDGKFLGMVIDIENQDNQSDKRIKAWCKQLQSELLG